MITKVSELLKGFIDEERKKLDEFSLKHGPTIGEMYEGLTSDFLNKVIPPSLNLRIVSGFIYDDMQVMTGQIDCMLVRGEGIQIPHTDYYKWHIKDVITILEVKKTLYTNDLVDSFNLLREVSESYHAYVRSGKLSGKINISSACNTYAAMTGLIAPPYNHISKLPFEMQMIYYSLVMEQLSPITVVLGYHGFKSEFTLRKALVRFLENNVKTKGFGIINFPHLIICGEHSLVKLNGQPYCPKLRNKCWDFYASSSQNPVRFLLELIWTKLEHEYPIGGFWGEDLEIERFSLFLSAKAAKDDGMEGWAYGITELTEQELRENSGTIPWEPIYLDVQQFSVINILGSGKKTTIKDTDFQDWLKKEGKNPEQFVASLTETGLVALDGDELRLITEKCMTAVLPNGQFVAAEESTGRFSRWLKKRFALNGI
jgi:hypothetical protein